MKQQSLMITSPAFEAEGIIPAQYTCDGAEVSPPLHIEQIPDGAASLAMKVEDPDAPGGTFIHWLVWNINPAADIEAGALPGISGKNSAGKTGYHGPCPPSGRHRYYFHIYALDAKLELPAGAEAEEFEHALEGHVIAEGSIMGYYERGKQQTQA
jgi:hypothetical protein